MKIIRLILFVIIYLMPTALIYGQEGWGTKIKAYNGEIKESFSGGRVDVDGINKENMMYEYELMRSKVRYYIYFKKNIGTNENPKYKTLDSLIIYRNKLPKDHYFTDTGLYEKDKIKYQSLPTIVRKTKTYQGDFYKIIYKAWYYDIKNKKIKEIKLPNKNFKVYDQSHE